MTRPLKHIVILLGLLYLLVNAEAQNNDGTADTIYIYEVVEVYDTIYVYDTIIEPIRFSDLSSLNKKAVCLIQIDSTTNYANLIIISDSLSATIPLNGIILTENTKQLESMKKMSFLSVMLFAANTLIFAQTDYGISAGAGTWWANSNHSHSTADYTPTYQIGLFVKQNFKNRMFIQADIKYGFSKVNNSYRINREGEFDHSLLFYDEIINSIENPRPVVLDQIAEHTVQYSDGIGDPESHLNFHTINIPLLIGYKIKRFEPYVGIEYSYKIPVLPPSVDDSYYEIAEPEWAHLPSLLDYFENSHHIGLKAGLNYTFLDNFTVGLDYYTAFTTDFNYKAYSFDCGDLIHTGMPYEDHAREDASWVKDYTWKSNYINITLAVKLNGLIKWDNKNMDKEEVIVPGYGKPYTPK